MLENGGMVGRQGSQNYWVMGRRGKLVDANGKAMKPIVDDKWEKFEGEIKGEVWKEVEGIKVSTFGRVKDGKEIVDSVRLGLGDIYVKLENRIKLCNLVANAFIPHIEGKEFIRHKDGNIYNNNAENLEWTQEKTKVKKKNKEELKLSEIIKMIEANGRIKRADWSDNYCNYYSIKGEKIVDVDDKAMKLIADGGWAEYRGDIKGEIWKPINEYRDYRDYEVSNYGRVRRIISGRLFPITLVNMRGWGLTAPMYDKKNNYYVNYPVDRLVVRAFCNVPKEKRVVVIHKDGHITNNYVDNLEWRVK